MAHPARNAARCVPRQLDGCLASQRRNTWTATAFAPAQPAAVLEVLTNPDVCARWAPLSFDVGELPSGRLATGTRTRVSGMLAGRRVGFDLEVHVADETGLALTAEGPLGIEVDYRFRAVTAGSEVHASISVRPSRGLAGRLLAEVTGAILSAGALEHAISRIAHEAATTSIGRRAGRATAL